MSHTKTTAAAFLSLTTLVVIGAAAGLALAWPHVQSAAHHQAASLVGEAATANSAEAMADYRLAVRLDPTNIAAKLGLARTQIKAGQAEAALTTLKSAGEGSEASQLRVRTLIELGRIDAATGLLALIGLQNAPDAAQHVARVQAGTLSLAAELYAAGLPNSSSALLLKQPISFTRNILLARIAIDRHTAADLTAASDNLATAVTINPSDAQAHRLFASVLADRGLTDESAQQTQLADRIESGRP
jgi:tetratricopeptide (TPR) repeat protein